MLKTNRLLAAGAAFVAASVMGFAASAQTKWDMPTPYGDTNFHTVNIAKFAEDVAASTDGALTIQIHSAGSLLKHPEIKNGVRKGVVPIGEVLISRLSNEDPVFALDSVPFLATSYDASMKLYQASKPVLEKKLEEQGLKLLFAVPWPPQGIYTKEAVDSIDDLKGMRFRAYNASTERIAQLAGAVPTQVEVPDLPTAFSTGRVQAMITSPSTGANSKAWDYLGYYYDAQAWLPKNMVIVNKAAFEALPDAVQTAVLEAAAKAETSGWEASKNETAEKTQMLVDNGIEVSAPSKDLQDGFKAIGKTMVSEWQEQAGDDGKAIIEAFSK
ncbi:TRAP transporter substrate-binding protein [Breoghania sp.]|uniref:TRAP transporter substrate-binding protein n=1 Tax=Breoghania sp. TaxID=2065378 RepID=UPI002AA67B35|nr:TRAP transporter substrate-binding protein [Breoghania sp.]